MGASPPLSLPIGASRLISRNLASERESLASPPRSHHGSVSSGASGGTDGWAEGWAESGACSSILAEAYEEIEGAERVRAVDDMTRKLTVRHGDHVLPS